MGPLCRPNVRYELPSALREESMIAARDELASIGQSDSIGRLDGCPLGKHLRALVPAVLAVENRPINGLATAQIAQGLGHPVSHQDRRVPSHAVGTRMKAAPIGVHAPLEAEVRALVAREDLLGVVLEDLQLGVGGRLL